MAAEVTVRSCGAVASARRSKIPAQADADPRTSPRAQESKAAEEAADDDCGGSEG